MLLPGSFSGGFSALEVLSAKNFDVIRRPSWKEVRSYANNLAAVIEDSSLGFEQKLRRVAMVSRASQIAFLERTATEQRPAIDYKNPDFVCRCMNDRDCGALSFCNMDTGACEASCESSAACEQSRVAAGREDCLPAGANRTCQRVAPSCTTDGDCTFIWGDSTAERCLVSGGAAGSSCEIPCAAEGDCVNDPLRPLCDGAAGYCISRSAVAAADQDPCPTVAGTLDDWFQMLNRGVNRTLLANSDSHSDYQGEAGLPRTYVRQRRAAAEPDRFAELGAER